MKPKLQRLEALRAFACLGVFTFHCYISLLGTWAVSVFVMLSGFLLTYNGLDRVDFFPNTVFGCAKYSFKKIRKLYPLYFITLLILALRIFLLAPDNPDMEQINFFIKQFILSVLLIQSWPPNTDWAFGFNGVGWYLSTSVILYFAFPWILRYVKRFDNKKSALLGIGLIYVVMIIIAFIAAIVHRQFTGAGKVASDNFQHWFTYVFPPFRLGDFTIGCLLGYIFANTDTKKPSTAKATAFEAFAILLFIITQFIFTRNFLPSLFACNMLFIPSSSMLILSFAMERGHISRFLDCKATRLIADYSIEIFLIHFAVIKYASPFSTMVLGSLPFRAQQLVFLGFAFIITALACIIYRRFSRRFPFFSVR